jgi:Fe2+ or Zn2+ uptake regulation protein
LTSARRAVVEAIIGMPGAFTVDSLADALQGGQGGPVATATLYRAVAALEKTGFIERVGMRAGSALYVRCDAYLHHHHFICEGCGRTAAAQCPPQLASLAPDGYVVTRHEITLFGLCPTCALTRPKG